LRCNSVASLAQAARHAADADAPDLARLIRAWTKLPPAVRAGIAAMVQASAAAK
jgi:hypothetical protein